MLLVRGLKDFRKVHIMCQDRLFVQKRHWKHLGGSKLGGEEVRLGCGREKLATGRPCACKGSLERMIEAGD